MAAVRRADVVWEGSLARGSGKVTAASSSAFSELPVSWASRTERSDGKTSPEELVAAAHASCFAMALSFGLGNRELAGEVTREWYERYRAEREAIDRDTAAAEMADALDDEDADEEIRAETAEALALTGKDVGTPILHFRPAHGGIAFFGPVISRLPSDEEAVELWEHVVALASFPGFAELKRSMRERPQLPAFGVRPGETGRQEDWHGGSRRQRT
jgi:hypothetical protein